MFGSNKKSTPRAKAGAADTLICKQTKITGDISFNGVLYIDGHVKGNITSEEVENSLLTIGVNGFVEGEVKVPHIMILGRVKGDVHALEHVELMAESRVEGDVYYQLIEMSMGAEVNGQMLHTVEKQKLLSHHNKTGSKKDSTSESENDKLARE